MDWRCALQPIRALPNDVFGLLERVDRHDHELDALRQRELPDKCQALGVIAVVPVRSVRVELSKVLLGLSEGLEYALSNRDGRYDHDKFAEAVLAEQLKR